MGKAYDPAAAGSDIPRSRKQYLARKLGSWIVSLFGLNRAGFLSTEIVQQIHPVCSIPTRFGKLKCKCDHGRLRWRALTFYSEEPETVKWLESLSRDDLLWDIGANVGLYSIYAAKFAGCKVLAVEPEAQNYATLIENIALNGVENHVEAANLAVSARSGLGRLHVHAITKGGAYNQFSAAASRGPESNGASEAAVCQLQYGVSLDDIVGQFGFPCPTHIKIDVDGNEPDILSGATRVLNDRRCRSVLVEVNREDPRHQRVVEVLADIGFRCVLERSSRGSRSVHLGHDLGAPANMIFEKVW